MEDSEFAMAQLGKVLAKYHVASLAARCMLSGGGASTLLSRAHLCSVEGSLTTKTRGDPPWSVSGPESGDATLTVRATIAATCSIPRS